MSTKRVCRISCRVLLVLISIWLSILVLSACKSQEVELPFETIERSDYSPQYENKEPSLTVVANLDNVEELEEWITPKAIEQLRKTDYKTHFAIAAFLGWQSTGHEGIRIEQIVRRGNSVSVYALVGNPTGETEVTSPYHLVKVQKVGQWGSEVDFTLMFEENVVSSRSLYIP